MAESLPWRDPEFRNAKFWYLLERPLFYESNEICVAKYTDKKTRLCLGL